MERNDVDLSGYTEEEKQLIFPEAEAHRCSVIRREMNALGVNANDFESVCRRDNAQIPTRPCSKHTKCRDCEPRRWAIFGVGSYTCASCGHEWKSGHSWVVIDLFRQRVDRVYGQLCRPCNGSTDFTPCTFDLITWVCMIRKLLRMAIIYLLDNNLISDRRSRDLREKLKYPNDQGRGRFYRRTPVHDAARCEFCQERGVLCTRFDFHYYQSPEHPAR